MSQWFSIFLGPRPNVSPENYRDSHNLLSQEVVLKNQSLFIVFNTYYFIL